MVRWQTYRPSDTSPIDLMRVLTLLPLFITFGARAKMKTTAINAVKPRYAYCSNDDGIIGTSGIQYGKACMFQYQAKKTKEGRAQRVIIYSLTGILETYGYNIPKYRIGNSRIEIENRIPSLQTVP